MSNINSVNSNSSNSGTAKMERYYALNTMKSALQSSLGEIGKSSQFDLMFDALLDSISDDSSDLSKALDSAMGITDDSTTTNKASTGKTFNTKTGELLDDIDMQSVDNLRYLNMNSYLQNTSDSTSSSGATPEIQSLIQKYSQKYGVDANLISNVINAESSYDTNSVSSAGAMGLMQLMPSVCSEMGVTNPYDPEQNIEAGVKLLKQHLDTYDGNVAMALMAYNAGAGTVASRGVTSASDLYKMPTETQNYVKKILSVCKA